MKLKNHRHFWFNLECVKMFLRKFSLQFPNVKENSFWEFWSRENDRNTPILKGKGPMDIAYKMSMVLDTRESNPKN